MPFALALAHLCRPRECEARSIRSRRAPPSIPRCSTASEAATELRKNPALYSDAGGSGQPQQPPASSSAAETAVAPSQPPRGRLKKPEVLAPAGGWPQLRAAVACGADAVYFGIDGLNARARAANFAPEELPAVMAELHAAGVKGFVALNILLYDSELADVEARVRAMASAGVDAVIVQDVGVVRLLRRVAPGLPVHASTQLTVTSAEGARFAASLGVTRVVAARELSVKELSSLAGGAAGTELEAFVHGALCVSYSGQCLSSEAWGGRSANRGQCAQACRIPYGLLVDGVLQALGDVKYLLSPQDLCGLDHVPALMHAGVACLKIEGRLKGVEYVAATVRAYRAAVDAAWHGSSASYDVEAHRRDLAQVFARGQDAQHTGLTPGFLLGVDHQGLVRGRAPRHRGVLLGTVMAVTPRGGVRLRLAGGCAARRGVGVVFDAGSPEAEEQGGSVFDLWDASTGAPLGAHGAEAWHGEVELTFGPKAVDARRISPGMLVWRTADPVLESRLRACAAQPAPRRPVTCAASGALGSPLRLTLTAVVGGESCFADTATPLALATARSLTADCVRREVGTLRGDGFALSSDQLDLSALDLHSAPLFLPAGDVKSARRRAAASLTHMLARHGRDAGMQRAQLALPTMLAEARAALAPPAFTAQPHAQPPAIRVLCRTAGQVDAALLVPWLTEVCLDFLEVHGLAAAVQRVQASGRRAVVATPRVLKPDEERLSTFYLRLRADALLVRSIGMLQSLSALGGAGAAVTLPGSTSGGTVRVPALYGDFSLNAANTLTAAHFLTAGLARLTPAHDLNAQQLAALARSVGPSAANQLEVVVHQHLPVFHTEHCVFARQLSEGRSFRDCGHPCETHALHLRDPQGQDHRVLADAGCRNTVFNAAAQSGAADVATLAAACVGGLRVELLDDPPHEVAPLLEAYRRLAEGRDAPKAVLAWLETRGDANGAKQGVTHGSLETRPERARADMKQTAAAGRNAAAGKGR